MATTTEAAVAKRGGGGKLSRSETVTVRLDPRLNYLCELASRAQRRTKSSFVEWAIETALNAVQVPGTAQSRNDPDCSVDDLAFLLYDVDEADRLSNLAFHAPVLMTHEERVIWKLATSSGSLWKGRWREINDSEEEWQYDPHPQTLIVDRYRKNFDLLKRVAEGEESTDSLPTLDKRPIKKSPAPPSPAAFDTDLDEDLPF